MGIEMSYPSAGHHDKDPGASANGFIERDEMDILRNMLLKELEKRKHSYITDYNAETNSQYQSRIKPKTGDVILDMHLNASSSSSTGVEVFISNNAGSQSKLMAKEIVDGLAKIMNIKNRGVKKESESARKKLGILNLPGTAVLIEFCFITNKNDMESFLKNRDKIVSFLADMLIKYDKNK